MKRRHLLAASTALLTSPLGMPFLSARAADTPGVTATEIKIGHTIAYSGPASAYGIIGKTHTAFWNQVNEQGGVAGRKINFISLDDGYTPPKTVEQVRRLVEQDQVAFLFNTLGTPTNSAIQRYVNQKKVPHLFLATGADKWGDYEHFPWTIGYQPSYRTEAQIYTKYILKERPDSKIAILYQNDDFGKDYPLGVKDVLGDKFDARTVVQTYETTDATIDSQITALKASGADVFLLVAIPKFAAQAIKKVSELSWKPMFLMTNVSNSVGAVITPAGPENAIGIITTIYLKDPTDHRWDNDDGMKEWNAFMAKNMPGADLTDAGHVYAYGVATAMLKTLRQCGDDFSRENIMKQVTNLHDVEIPVALPGIKLNTSPTNYHPFKAMQLVKWDGKTWAPFGDIIQGV
jgi:branched-chain amino acid transport system substrate-binding protein